MSLLKSIFEKLGLKKAEKPAATQNAMGGRGTVVPGGAPTIKPMSQEMGKKIAEAGAKAEEPAEEKPVEMPMVDVQAMLDNLAKKSPIELNWRQSINDLMALLGLPHKPEDIRELAVELGCPESEMGDSYKRNVWTHKALLKAIAENGGKVPPELLD